MKIGFFTDSYHPYTSGVVRSIDTFKKQLERLGHEVFIFAPKYPVIPEEVNVFRFPSISAPTNHEFFLPVPVSPKINRQVANLGLDIIHVHSPFLLGSLGYRYAKKYNLPLIMTYHTLYDQYLHYLPFAKNASIKVIQKYLQDFCNKCDKIIVPTGVIGDELRKAHVITPYVVIPTGIELQEFSKGDRDWLNKKFGFTTEHKVLISVGRISAEKNIEFLIQAFRDIHLTMSEVRLVLVGAGPQMQEYQEIVEQNGLSGKIVFTGNLNRSDLCNCYLSSDVFVFASKTETQGIVLAEAKACGLPIVAINAFGVGEMVVDGVDGYLVDDDKKMFVQKVLTILNDQAVALQLKENAIVNAKLLSADRMAAKLADVYGNFLKKHEKIYQIPL